MTRYHIYSNGSRQASCLNCGKPRMMSIITDECRLTLEMKRALLDFAYEHGKQWKSKLLKLWQTGEDTGGLRLARNVVGPSRLHKLTIDNLVR